MEHSRRRIWHATEGFGAHVAISLRCAPRLLVSCHLLGPESRIFKLLLEEEVKKQGFDDDVIALEFIRRRICRASENSGAHVAICLRCAPHFLLARHLLGPESPAF